MIPIGARTLVAHRVKNAPINNRRYLFYSRRRSKKKERRTSKSSGRHRSPSSLRILSIQRNVFLINELLRAQARILGAWAGPSRETSKRDFPLCLVLLFRRANPPRFSFSVSSSVTLPVKTARGGRSREQE